MSRVFLPGFNLAPNGNIAAVQRDADVLATDIAVTIPEWLNPPLISIESSHVKGVEDARRRSSIASHIAQLQPGRNLFDITDDSDWDDLTDTMDSWTRSHFKSMSQFDDPYSKHLPSLEAAVEGNHTIIAFLEVLPRVLFRQKMEMPNQTIREYARKSQGFVTEWARLDGVVDYELAFALARRKPRRIKDVYKGLRFDPERFQADETTYTVGLNPARAVNLRGEGHRIHPARYLREPRVLLACVAMRAIPALYQSAVAAAFKSGLFSRTYAEERAKYALLD